MNKVQKIISAAVVSIGMCVPVASVFANAFENNGANMFQGNGQPHNQVNPAETPAQRLAQLHDKLGITADQEAAWTTFVTAMTPTSAPQKPAPSTLQSLSAPDRMDKMVAMLKTRETDLTNRAAAVRAVYGVLTTAQQKIFDAQFAMHGRHHKGKPVAQ